MTFNRRDFLKVAGLAVAAAACTPVSPPTENQPQPTVRPPTEKIPDTPVPPTEIPNAVKPGQGGPETENFLNETAEGKAYRLWYEAWVAYWSTAIEKQRVMFAAVPGSADSRLSYKVQPGSNFPTLESPDFPGVAMTPPAWAIKEMANPPEVQPNHTIPEGNGPLMLSLVSGAEAAKAGIPEGSSLLTKNGEAFYIGPQGEAVGYVNWDTGRWEKLDFSEFAKITDFNERDANRIERPNVENVKLPKFRLFGKFIDSTGPFPADVFVNQIALLGQEDGDNNIRWTEPANTDGKLHSDLEKNPKKLPWRRGLAFGVINAQEVIPEWYFDMGVDVVKVIDARGRVAFFTTLVTLGFKRMADNYPGMIPLVWGKGAIKDNLFGYPDATKRTQGFKKWAETGAIPSDLETQWLFCVDLN